MPDDSGRDTSPVVPFGPRLQNGNHGPRPVVARLRSLVSDDPHLDLVAVQADDALIDALCEGRTVSARGTYGYGFGPDDHVSAMLAAWKAEVDAEPIPELIDLDTAVAAIRAGRGSSSRRVRHLAPVAAVVAAAVVAVGSVSVGSAAAEPDTFFWPVSKVLFSQRAASIEAADRVEVHIARAKVALTQGDPGAASQELQRAQTDLGDVRPQEGRADLAAVQSFLVAKAVETPPGTKADLQAPLQSDPARTVPAGTALTVDPDPSVGATLPTPPSSATPLVSPPVLSTSDPRRLHPPRSTSASVSPDSAVPTSGPTSGPVGSTGPAATSSPPTTARDTPTATESAGPDTVTPGAPTAPS